MTGNLTPPSAAQSKHSLEVMIQRVVQGTASVTGDAFFSALVENLALALDVRNCAVSKLLENGQLQTLGLFCDGQLQSSITYSPISGPCGIVLTEEEYYCPDGIQDIFPNHPVLSALDANSYVGVCLKTVDGKILGNLLVIDSHSILESQLYKSILKIFAARAAAELERQQTTLELQQLNEELELRVERRTAELQAVLQNLLKTQAQQEQSLRLKYLSHLNRL